VAITGGATNVITNEGTIVGATFSVLGGNGADVVTSSGAFEGDVSLGNGADRLTLQEGALLDGAADGGAGADAIVLDGSGTYAGAITRFETLSKTGAGAWRLTGGPSSVSATTIAAGELAIDGTLSTSMTVLPGGTLSGSGIIVGDVTSGGGTVSPGSPTGRLTVSGNYASDANSTFRAAIDDAGGGSLSVAGTALLDGRLEIDPMPGDYSGGQVYDLLVAAGGVTGQFALVLVTQPLDFVLAYLADRVRLTTLRSDFTALAETPNQRAVAAYLDDINPPPGSDLETVFVELSSFIRNCTRRSTRRASPARERCSARPMIGSPCSGGKRTVRPQPLSTASLSRRRYPTYPWTHGPPRLRRARPGSRPRAAPSTRTTAAITSVMMPAPSISWPEPMRRSGMACMQASPLRSPTPGSTLRTEAARARRAAWRALSTSRISIRGCGSRCPWVMAMIGMKASG
jgi:hypothetical protein